MGLAGNPKGSLLGRLPTVLPDPQDQAPLPSAKRHSGCSVGPRPQHGLEGPPGRWSMGSRKVCVPRQATAAPEAQGLLPWCGDAAGSCDLCRGPLVMWVPSAVGKPRGLLRKLLSALPAWNTRADDGLNRRRGLRSVPGHTSSPPAVPPQRCPFCRLACYLESQSELGHPLPPGPSSQGAFGGRVVIPCHGH